MTSKEIIRRNIEYKNPPRVGFDFNPPHKKDIRWVPAVKLVNPKTAAYRTWGLYPEVKELVPNFGGEVNVNVFGNIYGRLKHDSNGECIKGALEDNFDAVDSFIMPDFDENYKKELREMKLHESDQFILGTSPVSVFSTFRDLRLMSNALTDILIEKENTKKLMDKILAYLLEIAEGCKGLGFDALIIYDDWGMQHSTFISPQSFREFFKPMYAAIAKCLHAADMKLFIHSCGLVTDFMEDFIDAGVDVMQFDQPEVYGSHVLAERYGKRIAFHCPVDIQKIMATGDRRIIEDAALHMVKAFKDTCGGGLIVKDYPTWNDINVALEWADWAREVVYQNATL